MAMAQVVVGEALVEAVVVVVDVVRDVVEEEEERLQVVLKDQGAEDLRDLAAVD